MSWSRTSSLLVLALLAVLAGCGGTQEPPAPPEGSVQLRENVPTSVGDLTLVASNIWDDSIVLNVADDGGPAESADVTVGDTVVVKGRSFELVSVHEDTGDPAPGGSAGYAIVVVHE